MTRKITPVIAGLGAIALIASTAACSSTRETATPAASSGAAGGLIGIARPSKSLERWNKDGSHLEELLKKAGSRRRCSTPTTRSTSRSPRSRT